jgi:Bacterial Ig-like domain
MRRPRPAADAHGSRTRLAILLLPWTMACALLLLAAVPASAIMIVNRTPAPGAVGVPRNVQPTVTFDVPPAGVTTRFHLRNAAGAMVPTILAPTTAAGTVWRLDPRARLAPGVTYTVVLERGITDAAGGTLPARRWSFTTRGPAANSGQAAAP